jgi:carbon monoxide dehydrogenase subunit G
MMNADRTETIAATPEQVWALIADVEGYGDWHPFFSDAEVHERDAEDRVLRAAFSHVTSVVTLHTELRFTYEDGVSVRASGTGKDLKSMTGGFELHPEADGVALRHTIGVDPGFKIGLLLRGPVEERVRNGVLDGAFRGVRAKLES